MPIAFAAPTDPQTRASTISTSTSELTQMVDPSLPPAHDPTILPDTIGFLTRTTSWKSGYGLNTSMLCPESIFSRTICLPYALPLPPWPVGTSTRRRRLAPISWHRKLRASFGMARPCTRGSEDASDWHLPREDYRHHEQSLMSVEVVNSAQEIASLMLPYFCKEKTVVAKLNERRTVNSAACLDSRLDVFGHHAAQRAAVSQIRQKSPMDLYHAGGQRAHLRHSTAKVWI
ncbi:hypothetical protein B0H10DRAFT_751908 [Mycena sp. CBHHK59/15]|nr:hypothetical protein B0H10DRAFT_751908 [Mycena sp. CBHHK59/15]